MFEKEIKFIVDFNLNKVKKSGTFFTLDKLSSAGVHPSIVRYISAELDLMIYEDWKRLLKNSMFDYSGNEIARHFSMISREIKRKKRIEFEDLKKLVIQAVSFNANHVVRPRWSLSKLIFDPSPTRPVEEINILLGYPYYYGYARNILMSYLNKKKVPSLSVNDFDQVYARIDTELFGSGNPGLLDNAISSMSDFFNEGAAVKDKLSPELVLIFLREKGLTEPSSRLRQAIPADVKQKYNIKELRSILYGTPGVEISTAPEKTAEPKPPVKAQMKEEPPEPAGSKEETPDEIINSAQAPGTEKPEEFVKVVSNLPLREGELQIEYEDAAEEELISKPEEEVAEEINLPIIEESAVEGKAAAEDIDETEEETNIILPDEEVEEILNGEPEKEISPEEITTDQDEIKFDLEEKEKLDQMYEFEEDKPAEVSPAEEYQVFGSAGFNLNELENELKQIEEEFNIPSVPPQKKAAAPGEKKTSAGDIFRLLSDREIDRIISHIFNEDREDFTNTLERISECRTYEEATEILKSVFLTYRINPYSRDAVSLTNAVSRYFDKK